MLLAFFKLYSFVYKFEVIQNGYVSKVYFVHFIEVVVMFSKTSTEYILFEAKGIGLIMINSAKFTHNNL